MHNERRQEHTIPPIRPYSPLSLSLLGLLHIHYTRHTLYRNIVIDMARCTYGGCKAECPLEW